MFHCFDHEIVLEGMKDVCIDGFSCLITHCMCCHNNKVETVLGLFEESTKTFGLPPRARYGYGMENVLVAQFLLRRRGLDRCLQLAGRESP